MAAPAHQVHAQLPTHSPVVDLGNLPDRLAGAALVAVAQHFPRPARAAHGRGRALPAARAFELRPMRPAAVRVHDPAAAPARAPALLIQELDPDENAPRLDPILPGFVREAEALVAEAERAGAPTVAGAGDRLPLLLAAAGGPGAPAPVDDAARFPLRDFMESDFRASTIAEHPGANTPVFLNVNYQHEGPLNIDAFGWVIPLGRFLNRFLRKSLIFAFRTSQEKAEAFRTLVKEHPFLVVSVVAVLVVMACVGLRVQVDLEALKDCIAILKDFFPLGK